MIIGYHTQITKDWTKDDLHHKLSVLPRFLQKKISKKRKQMDAQLSIAGNLLLLKLIDHFRLDLTLDDLRYSQYQRPYFDGRFDFNVSHSGDRVICCGTMDGTVGVDIELTEPLDVDYHHYFNPTEQQNIRSAKDQQAEFFKYWTRKEAILKALGTGVYTPLLDIDVSDDLVAYQDHVFHLLPVDIDTDFAGCLACDVRQELIITKVEV